MRIRKEPKHSGVLTQAQRIAIDEVYQKLRHLTSMTLDETWELMDEINHLPIERPSWVDDAFIAAWEIIDPPKKKPKHICFRCRRPIEEADSDLITVSTGYGSWTCICPECLSEWK